MIRPITFVMILTAGFSVVTAAQSPSGTPKVIKLAATPRSGALAPTADRAAYVGDDKKLYFLNLSDGSSLHSVNLSNEEIDRIAVSPGGNWIFTGDHAGNFVVWNADKAEAQFNLHMMHYPGPAVFSRDGKMVAVAPESDPIQILDSSTGRKICEIPTGTGGVQSIAFTRDGTLLAAADSDTTVRIYDARNGRLISQYTGFVLEPLAVEFTADGKELIASGADKVIVFIDPATGKLIRRLPKLDQPVSWSSIAVSPDGKLFAAILMVAEDLTKPRAVAVWDVTTGQKQTEWTPPSVASDLAWTSDGHLIFVGAQADSLNIWRIR